MIKRINLSATNISNIKSWTFQGGYDGGAYTSTIICESHSVNIGDFITIYFWYNDDVPYKVFSGYVKQIQRNIPDNVYTITIYDVLIRAVDYFIASSTPDSAYKIKNISAESLVGNILSMAGITNYGHGTSYFTFGVNGEGEVNLTGAYDFIHGVADLLAWHIYADKEGKVWFVDRKPYVMSGDTPKLTITEILAVSPHNKTDRDLRNRVVVYGRGVFAEAKASSPYLPTGFYKSVVLSSPHIDSQQFAQMSADYNLTKLNKLTEEVMIRIEGIPELFPMDVIEINNQFYPDINGNWFVYSLSSSVSDRGFIQELILRK